jgi:DNA-directed RNA polymerase beta subunit
MPWERYNLEDAEFIHEHLTYENIYTFIHTKKYEIEASTT